NWGLKQNGAPVSESNPLAVNVVKVPDGTPGGGGFFSNLFGGIKNLLGLGGGAPPGIRRRGGGPYNYEDSPNAGELTKLITAEAKRAGIDPRLMEGIRAGESAHTSRYDIKDDARESSWGPFQLNRRSGLMGHRPRMGSAQCASPGRPEFGRQFIAHGQCADNQQHNRELAGPAISGL